MNEMLYDIIDGQETYVGFCYVHQGRKVTQVNVDGCQHHVCVNLRNRVDKPLTMFNIANLKHENEIGKTTQERETEITDQAKADGRDIQRPT